MKKNQRYFLILFTLSGMATLYGGTGRPSDGHLFFFVLLGLLLVVLGIFEVVELVRYLIRSARDDFGYLG